MGSPWYFRAAMAPRITTGPPRAGSSLSPPPREASGSCSYPTRALVASRVRGRSISPDRGAAKPAHSSCAATVVMPHAESANVARFGVGPKWPQIEVNVVTIAQLEKLDHIMVDSRSPSSFEDGKGPRQRHLS